MYPAIISRFKVNNKNTKKVQNMFRVNNKNILVILLLTWTSKCYLGKISQKTKIKNKTENNQNSFISFQCSPLF